MATPPPVPALGLDYARPPAGGRGWWRGWIGWVLFIGVAIMCLALLNSKSQQSQQVPLNRFMGRIDSGAFTEIQIDGDELIGVLRTPVTGPNQVSYRMLRTDLPPGTAAGWGFVQDLTARSGGADIVVRDTNNLFVNILLPLIPWLLIFGFIWFFLIRNLRKANAAGLANASAPQPTTLVISGPGRWIPDEPDRRDAPDAI